ncbi:amino acid transporter AVT1J-like isoform X4 [Camellia sinensis]|uniref:amino acid transporter AVT1J-like isoform X4 n=1 Tax=Camellia sinensis TaxID=4442 RepID=UPI001036EE52|nr:amino acid transporter AVT1J-like isoform X4 [Camellia sinensis]
MEGVPEDGYTINVPLLVDNNDENEDKLYENEAEGNTSFFKTCFNGFNALSGFVPMLSLMYNYVCINGAYWIFDVWFKDLRHLSVLDLK